MNLYLARHGEALSPLPLQPASLTPAGKKELIEKSQKLSLQGVTVWHSEKLRTKESARLLAPNGSFQTKKALNPDGDAISLLLEIEQEERDLLIVSHEPLLHQLYAALPAEGKIPLHFDVGSLVIFQKSGVLWRFVRQL